MAANHAREVAYEIEIGFDGDGRILGIRAVIRADIGAYVRTAALVPAEFGAALLPGPYRVPNYACDLWSRRHQQDAGRHAALARAAPSATSCASGCWTGGARGSASIPPRSAGAT